MKIEKEKYQVNIFCQDGSVVKGVVHLSPGTRLSDFMNDSNRNFVIVTDAQTPDGAKKTIFLNKSFIKWVEEV